MKRSLISLLAVILFGIAGCRSFPAVRSSGGDWEDFSDMAIEVFPEWHLPEWEFHEYCFGLCTREEWR